MNSFYWFDGLNVGMSNYTYWLQPVMYMNCYLPQEVTKMPMENQMNIQENSQRQASQTKILRRKIIGHRRKKSSRSKDTPAHFIFSLFLILGSLKKKVQNPLRNIVTNIVNQILSFMMNKSKSQEILRKVEPHASAQWENKFYDDLKKLKLKCSGYFNLNKLKDMLFGSKDFDIDVRSLKLRRIMNFIDSKLIPSLMTSKKLSAQLIAEHLTCRRRVDFVAKGSERQKFTKQESQNTFQQ